MDVNVRALKKLLDEKFDNNKAKMARTLGINKSHIQRVLKDGKGAGAIFCGAIIKYCQNNNLDFLEYIFLL